jgi:hypothetical protein
MEELPRQLTAAHREFLLTMVQGSPAWERMPMQHLHELPALKWKQMNLAQLRKRSAARFAAQREAVPARRQRATDEKTKWNVHRLQVRPDRQKIQNN